MADNTPQEPNNNPVNQVADTAKQTAQATTDQAKQALNKGVEQLKNVDVKGLLTPKANQPKVSSDEKLWAVASYVPLVAFLALLIKPDSGYLKLHGRQGIVLSIIFFLSLFLISWIPFIGDWLFNLIWLALTITGVFAAYNAFVGNWFKIPVIGDLAEQIPLEMFNKIVQTNTTGNQQNPPATPPASPEQPSGNSPPPTN